MLNFYNKLAVIVLGALTLGLLPVVVAESDFRATNWAPARQQLDCPMTCRATGLKYVMMDGVDHKEGKPLSICATKKDREWLVGYNRWKENTCNVAIGEEVFHGERYYCLCTTHPRQPLG